MNKYEKFSLIAITALSPFFAIQSPLVQQKVDSISHEYRDTTIIQNVEDFRWNNLKNIAMEGIEGNSYEGRSLNYRLSELDTKEYKEKLKNKDFYELEVEALKDTKSELLVIKERIDRRKPPKIWKFEEEKSEPVVIDLKKETNNEAVLSEENETSVKPKPISMESVHQAREKIREKFLNTGKDLSQQMNNNI